MTSQGEPLAFAQYVYSVKYGEKKAIVSGGDSDSGSLSPSVTSKASSGPGVMGYLASPLLCTPAQFILGYCVPRVRNILRISGTPLGNNVPPMIERASRSRSIEPALFNCTKKKMANEIVLRGFFTPYNR